MMHSFCVDKKEKLPLKTEETSSSEVLTEAKDKSIVKQNSDDEKPSDNSDDDDSGQENDDRKKTAPLELMGEVRSFFPFKVMGIPV